jgi:ADP-ribose pyrophosphatase YjhB (NUDIX family)
MISWRDKGIQKKKWIEEGLWREITRSVPIACLDVAFEREDGSILYGYRVISPYRNVWALPGGRIVHGETLSQCARRIAREYGLSFDRLYEIGVFPVRFRTRSDLSVAAWAPRSRGQARADGKEFTRIVWSRNMPSNLGENYRLMVDKLERARHLDTFIELNRIL